MSSWWQVLMSSDNPFHTMSQPKPSTKLKQNRIYSELWWATLQLKLTVIYVRIFSFRGLCPVKSPPVDLWGFHSQPAMSPASITNWFHQQIFYRLCYCLCGWAGSAAGPSVIDKVFMSSSAGISANMTTHVNEPLQCVKHGHWWNTYLFMILQISENNSTTD